ncbi:hypothetical protein FQN57_005578 [Myotisia sp. PD_48]|nr:hypothetical protein FQN57_005578 [Myotisia sp. PD_48]
MGCGFSCPWFRPRKLQIGNPVCTSTTVDIDMLNLQPIQTDAPGITGIEPSTPIQHAQDLELLTATARFAEENRPPRVRSRWPATLPPELEGQNVFPPGPPVYSPALEDQPEAAASTATPEIANITESLANEIKKIEPKNESKPGPQMLQDKENSKAETEPGIQTAKGPRTLIDSCAI